MDSKHRVWMLDARSFEVFEVDATGLSDPRQLTMLGEPPDVVPSAAMGDGPDDWLLFVGVHEVRRIVDGEEVTTPALPWLVSSVAYFDGEPAAFTLPAAPGGRLGPIEKGTPWLMILHGSWRVSVEADADEGASGEAMAAAREGRSPLAALRGRYDGQASQAGKGGLWLADTYRHRVRRLARSGRITTTLTVGAQQVEYVEFSANEAVELAQQGVPKAILGGGRLRRAIEAVSEAADGRLYVLGSADALEADRPGPHGDLALFRFDPVLLTYERVELDFRGAAGGKIQLAAGRDGLFVLGYYGGLHLVSWDVLESAEWLAVEGVELDGRALFQPAGRSAAP